MKNIICVVIFVLVDIAAIALSLVVAFFLKNLLNALFGIAATHELLPYLSYLNLYIVTIFVFAYIGIYTKRYDFWHESLLIFKGLLFSMVLLFFLMVVGKESTYSRVIIIFAFMIATVIIPPLKLALKRVLFGFGLWARRAKIISKDKKFKKEIFKNSYLGYVPTRKDDYETLFIDSQGLMADELSTLIQNNIFHQKEIVFTPLLKDYDFSRAKIYNLFNTRTNLFLIQNSLQSPLNRALKTALDYTIALLILPIFVVIFVVVLIAIKLEEPRGSILFTQRRVGQNGKEFGCYKFRTMREDGDIVLRQYLQANPWEVEFYNKFKKYKNDPRITKIGKILRATSLDELPQLINILKLEMSVVGPRPVPKGDYEGSNITKEDLSILLLAKPGITGLAQISGRGDLDFESRVAMNVWYAKNWNVYNDIVIILKTIIPVLTKRGAS